ncbi:MAG: hypothetical protein QNK92_12060 [Amylibacter sp.]
MSRHPLVDILDHLKSDTRFDFTLVEEYEGKLMRLKCPTPNIWVMVAPENGSMVDRWALDGGATFVKYTDDDLAKGPEHNAKALLALAQTEQDKKQPAANEPNEQQRRLKGIRENSPSYQASVKNRLEGRK